MRTSGKILGKILNLLAKEAKAGVTPKQLANLAAQELATLGAEPAFLGVPGNPNFPDVICISVNDQVQHSIPTSIPLENNDIVNLDFGVKYGGMITDAGITICVGSKPTEEERRLLEGTKKALDEAIKVVRPGVRVGDISRTIQTVLESYNLGIVRELVGHGVGQELHEDPEIPNYGFSGSGPKLIEGCTIAIEPITTLGDHRIVFSNDGWTIRTRDGSKSAQFEHTILVTKNGCEVLTLA